MEKDPDLDRVAAIVIEIAQERLRRRAEGKDKEGDSDADGGLLPGVDR